MNKNELKRMSKLVKLCDDLKKVLLCSYIIKVGDTKNMDKAKNKANDIIEKMTDTISQF